jgi:arylsulfatase A-like enzyme/Flp pilus assembly protein TadD
MPSRRSPRIARIARIMALTTLACGASCGSGTRAPGTTVPAPGTNVLLITLDTTRADRLGAYGHAGADTPHIDALAAGGARFERAYAHVPLTLPTHASLLTGTFPPEHGIHDNGRRALGSELPTLAEVFAAHGYRTGAFVGAIALDGSFGLDRGFEVYDDDMGEPAPQAARVLDRPAAQVVDGALRWLRQTEGPFFLWTHFYDPHAEYRPPPDFQMEDPYDGELAYVDSQIGRLIGWLEAERQLERTLVVVVADHGESLGEKGEHAHGALIYEGTQRIPLLLFWPGEIEAGLRVEGLVQQVDLFPTLLELFDWSLPAQVSGHSFAPLLRGEAWEERAVYLESEYCALNFGWSSLRGLVSGRWKYIQAPRPELYDLTSDPGETHDLAATRPDVVRRLERELAELRASMRTYSSGELSPSSELTADLGALGYVQGSAAPNEITRGENPIERIEILELYHAAVGFGNHGQTERMLAPLERVVEACPEGAGFRTLLGDTYRRLGRYDEARVELERALELDADYDPAHFYLGALREALGQVEPALAAYRRNLDLRPEYVPARESIARILAARGDDQGALDEYDRIVELDPNQARHWIARANLELRLGRPAQQVAALRRAAQLAPEALAIQSDYAWVLATSPEAALRNGGLALEIARRCVRESGRRQPDLLDTLAAALAEQGEFEEARAVAREALELARAAGSPERVQLLQAHLDLLERGQPLRAR